jgi:Holliday junction resolvase RusA-like endonuclease
MEMEIAFTIPGPPVGKGRPKFARRGAFVSAYTPQKTASYESLVKLVASQAMRGHDLLSGPLIAIIIARNTPPASWSKKKKAAALEGGFIAVKPDLDNLAKAILDACNGIVFQDDAQIAVLLAAKAYADTADTNVIFRAATINYLTRLV